MKPLLLITLIFSFVFFICCEKTEQDEKLCIANISYEKCLSMDLELSDSVSIIVDEGHRLLIKHYNTFLNCCGGEISVTSELRNDTIFIWERIISSNGITCAAICPYNIEYTLGNLNLKDYVIVFNRNKYFYFYYGILDK